MSKDSRIQTKRVLWYQDLNEMIKETFGRKWDFQQQDFLHNGTVWEEEVPDPSLNAVFLRDVLVKIEEWKKSPPAKFEGRDNYPGRTEDESIRVELEEFLVGLAHHGKLEPGPITISVHW